MSNENIKLLEQKIAEEEKIIEMSHKKLAELYKQKEIVDAQVRKYRRIQGSLRFKVTMNLKKVSPTQQQDAEHKNAEDLKEEPVVCQQKPKKKKANNQGKAKTFKRKSKRPGRV